MGLGKPAPKGRARIGGWGAAALITLALAATLLGGGQIGHATEASDGSAWLWSRTAGEVARVNPDSGQVEQRRGVTDARGHRVQVTQNDEHLLIHDLDTGRVSSLDLSGLGLSGRLDVGLRGDPHLAMTATAAAVIDRASGSVRALDPATLRPVGPVLQLPGPLAGGEFDDAGRLWVAVPQQGTAVALTVSARGAAVTLTTEVAEPGRDLGLSVLDQGALVVDRGGRDLVVATPGGTRRVTAPVPLAGALVPERTHGALAAITVPAAGSVVTLGDVGKSGPVLSFPLRDPVQEPAVPFAGKVYVPVRETGQVHVYDPAGRQTGVQSIPAGRGDLELQVREGNLFINAPGSPDARVIGSDGRARIVGKYPGKAGKGGDRPVVPGGGEKAPPLVPAPSIDPIFPNPFDPTPPHPGPAKPGIPPEPTESRTTGPKAGPSGGRPSAPRPSTRRPSSRGPSSKAPSSKAPAKKSPRPTTKPKPKPTRNPYTPQQVCNVGSGGGYYVQRSISFHGGRAYLLYSNSTKKNCAVTMKTANVGKGTSVWVQLKKQSGGHPAYDGGTFKYYAGPVYVNAPGICVSFSGGASGASASAGWGNCG
ncbi:hypothetical protein F8568_043235 [Actinomadura sp. LD22]|uniref:Uncharacterized protein n=1 Tax=Actinomadura physcomitrii TaxID=2650748 RepID=A0A6I4MME9_9ACTN|nr:hypothetical protein [Actinomadura physcomitrii]MWA07042.1 hypothetical protein [Actinomadura physcomitrii]